MSCDEVSDQVSHDTNWPVLLLKIRRIFGWQHSSMKGVPYNEISKVLKVATSTIFNVFGMTRPRTEPTTSFSQSGRSNHYANGTSNSACIPNSLNIVAE